MIKRVVTGTIFAILVLGAILLRGWYALALLSFGMVASIFEVYRAIRATGIEPVRWAGYVFCALTIIAEALALTRPVQIHSSTMVLLVSVMAAMVRLVMRGKIAVESLMATVFPMLYPGIFYMVLMELLQMEHPAWVAVALTLSFFSASINDVFALFSGMLFGKHKLSPVLSPKKTVEGSIGGLVASVLFSMAVPPLLKLIFSADPSFVADIEALPPSWAFGLLGLFAGALSQVGDLTASMVKRHCGVKDFGKILPGHGGVMDRMDGVLFCGAICYIFFRMIEVI